MESTGISDLYSDKLNWHHLNQNLVPWLERLALQ